MKKLASPVRLYDMERQFCIHSSKLVEVGWTVIRTFVADYGHIPDLPSVLLRRRSVMYSKCIADIGSPSRRI